MRTFKTRDYPGILRVLAALILGSIVLVGVTSDAQLLKQPEDVDTAAVPCDTVEVAQAAIDFYGILKQGRPDAIQQRLSDDSRFEEGGFMGMVVGRFQIAQPTDARANAEAIAATLTGVNLTDVAVSRHPVQDRADLVFRVRSAEQESVGKGAVRCSDLRIITFNFPLPEEPIGWSSFECSIELEPIGRVRVCFET